MQTKAEPPKGLAASRFADASDDESADKSTTGANGEKVEEEGETEPDSSSVALASVRTSPS